LHRRHRGVQSWDDLIKHAGNTRGFPEVVRVSPGFGFIGNATVLQLRTATLACESFSAAAPA
jgi:hypothetical protein